MVIITGSSTNTYKVSILKINKILLLHNLSTSFNNYTQQINIDKHNECCVNIRGFLFPVVAETVILT